MEELAIQFTKLKGMGKGCVPDAFDIMSEKCWCKAFFSPYLQCDIVSNKMTETFNGWLLTTREKKQFVSKLLTADYW